MADAPAARGTRGTTAFRTIPVAVFDVPAAHSAGGATAVRPTPVAVFTLTVPAVPRTRVPGTVVAAAAALVAAAAHQSAALACFVASAVSLVPVVRAAWAENVDGDLGRLYASLRRGARLARAGAGAARADLEADLRRLKDMVRGNAVLAPAYDRAEQRARAAAAAAADVVACFRTWAEARWGEHEGAARAACVLLRLVARAIYSVAAALIEEAHEQAAVRAPAALGYLRGVVREIRNQGLVPSSGIAYGDVSYLIGTAVYAAVCTDILVCTSDVFASSLPFWFLRSVASCLAALLVADWVCCQPDGPDETSIAADVLGAGSGETVTRTADEVTVPESWRYLWLLTIAAHIVDVYLLRVTLGPRPVAVAFLALCNVKVINAGKKAQLTPDGEGSGEGANGGAGEWRRVATAVLAASFAKVLAIFVVLGFQLAALSLVSLGVTAVLLLIREENLSDLEASVDDNGGEESSSFDGNIAGGAAAEEADEARTEHSSTIVDDAEAHGDGSEEPVEEQQREEPDSSSSSMDDWDFVEMDGFDTPRVADRS